MIKKILVGIDDSEHAERTLKRAHELQKRFDCELVVFHSIEHKMIPEGIRLPVPVFAPNSAYRIPLVDYKQLREKYVEKGKEILEKAKKIIGENPKVETRLVTELKPEDYIDIKVNDEGFDLVMLGEKGDHNMRERLFGSVTEKVMHETACDIMVIK